MTGNRGKRARRRAALRAGALLLAVGLAACDSDATGPRDALRGGVLATFDVGDERFRVWTTNAATIEQLFALRDPAKRAIPIGPVRRGSGADGHNAPWSWHLDPVETSMGQLSIELCDGLPSYVEAHLDEWIGTVGSYCPWGAKLTALEDFR